MSQIDFRLLQSAIVLADELSFSQAASRVHLTQPGLTKQIQDLESQLGVVLFERSSQGVILTEPCRVFIEHAKLAMFHLERAVHLTRAAAKGAEAGVNFGSSPYVDPFIVSTLLSVRLPLYPTLRVHAHSNFSQELTRQVASGELDIALVTPMGSNSRLNFLELADHPMYVLMQDRESAAARPTVNLNDFDDRVWAILEKHVHPVIQDRLLSRVDELGVRPRGIQYVTTAEEAAHFVHKHDGVAFLTRNGAWRVAHSGLTMRSLTDPLLRIKTAIITRTDDQSRLISEFLRAAVRRLETKTSSRQQVLPLAG